MGNAYDECRVTESVTLMMNAEKWNGSRLLMNAELRNGSRL